MDVQIDTSMMRIETDRLLLRPFEEGDLNDFYAYASVPGVGEMAGWPHHENIEDSRGILDNFVRGRTELAIWHKADRKVIGSFGFHISWANEDERYAQLPSKEIGYVLAKEYWGRGLMPEAAQAAMDETARLFGVRCFTCNHFVTNAQSRRVIEKCGFEFVSTGMFYSSLLKKTFEDRRYIKLIK